MRADDIPLGSARHLNAEGLERELLRARRRTLALAQAWMEALPDLRVPCRPTLNLPLWEWGHVAWFQAWWIGRNRQRHLGVAADPDHPRSAPRRPDADALYDSSRVAHGTRWALHLPDWTATKDELQRTLDETLDLLQADAAQGRDLYFWHLVLMHEDMHNEASVYMAQALGLPMPTSAVVGGGRAEGVTPDRGPRREVVVPAQTARIGYAGPGFAFDNELGTHEVSLPEFRIDDRVVNWAEYLAFVEETRHAAPPHLQRRDGLWWRHRFGAWRPLDLNEPAEYLSAFDAQAWCGWAGRALPTEAQWECAVATGAIAADRWAQVWEWTSSTFEAYPGFVPHPYRDYSAPWFGTHRVLRGASHHTDAHLVSPRYRNFFLPERADIPAGFRTVARV